jgi:hypothetical protein
MLTSTRTDKQIEHGVNPNCRQIEVARPPKESLIKKE